MVVLFSFEIRRKTYILPVRYTKCGHRRCGTGDVPDPNMSTTNSPSVTGGMVVDSGAESSEISSFNTQEEAVRAATQLRSEVRDHTQTMELICGRLQGWASGSDTDLTVPGEASEVPYPELGGRQWVTNHEGQVPFAVLTEMVRLVERKRKLVEARQKLDTLAARFDLGPAMSTR